MMHSSPAWRWWRSELPWSELGLLAGLSRRSRWHHFRSPSRRRIPLGQASASPLQQAASSFELPRRWTYLVGAGLDQDQPVDVSEPGGPAALAVEGLVGSGDERFGGVLQLELREPEG